MFFYLSKISTFLFDPVFLLLLFTFLSWITSKKQIRRKAKSLAIIFIFYLLSTDYIANSLFSILETTKKPAQIARHYDSAIILSGMTRSKNNLLTQDIEFTDAVDRILAGIDLVRSEKVDLLIISGGDGSLTQHQAPEAYALKEFAIKAGIAADRIIVDPDPRNTYENAVNSAEIINQRHLKKNILITSAFHMIRAEGCFRENGVEVDLLPVDYRVVNDTMDFRSYIPSARAIYRSGEFFHELIGIVVYGLTSKASYFD